MYVTSYYFDTRKQKHQLTNMNDVLTAVLGERGEEVMVVVVCVGGSVRCYY